MTQHVLDGFAMYDPDTGKVDGYLWRSLLSASWWTWQAELKGKRLLCRVLGHRLYSYALPVDSPYHDNHTNDGRTRSWTCTRCDWYEELPAPMPARIQRQIARSTR